MAPKDQAKLELNPGGWLQFNDSDKLVIVVELVDSWELSVLLAALEWHVRIRESVGKFLSLLLNNVLSFAALRLHGI